VSVFSFLDPQCTFPLPDIFSFDEFIETERELWALFPETEGLRVNFCQMGLTAKLFVESRCKGELGDDETYFLMPCESRRLEPLRMRALRRLTLDEFRMSHLTAMKLAESLSSAGRVMDDVHYQILGPGVLDRS
jgi:hypothetical protein